MPFSWPSHKATLVRRSVQRSQTILPTQAQKPPPAVEGVPQEGVIHSGSCAGLETRGSGSEPLLCKGERVPRLIRTEGHGRDQQGGHGNGANGPQAAQSHAKRTNVSQPWGDDPWVCQLLLSLQLRLAVQAWAIERDSVSRAGGLKSL